MLLLLLLRVTPALFLLSLNVSCEERSYLQIDTATVTATVASYFKRQYELNIGRLELRHCYCHSAIKKMEKQPVEGDFLWLQKQIRLYRSL